MEIFSFFSSADYILLLSVLLCGVLFIRTLYIIIATPVIYPDNSLSFKSPQVSVLLPVRNEASRILRENVQSLLYQSYPHIEIIAIDDRSADSSLEILQELASVYVERLKVIQGQEPPDNWIGKTFALEQAKRTSSSEWLITVDADVVYSDSIISASLEFAYNHRLDALSLLPQVTMHSFWESVVIPVMCWLSLMRVSTTQANRKTSKASFGYGNFILFRRSAHDKIGGFKAYKDNILDDCAIMQRLKSQGFNIMVCDGTKLMKSRMYASLQEIFLGFGKNSFAALDYSRIRIIAVVLAEILFVLFPLVYLLYGTLIENLVASSSFIIASVAVGCFFLTMLSFGLRMKAKKIFFVFYPLGHLIAIAIITYSMISFLSGRGVQWKKRIVKKGTLAQ